jgi:hypothetical protein
MLDHPSFVYTPISLTKLAIEIGKKMGAKKCKSEALLLSFCPSFFCPSLHPRGPSFPCVLCVPWFYKCEREFPRPVEVGKKMGGMKLGRGALVDLLTGTFHLGMSA